MRVWIYARLFDLSGFGTIDWNGMIYRTPSARRDQQATIA